MKKFFYTMIFAGLCAVGAEAEISKSDDGCYHISTAQDLKDFADKVNGGEYSACGKLDNDIELATIYGTTNSTKNTKQNNWTPISPFGGTFDGQGHSISNIYINNSTTNMENVGFIGRAYGGAIVRNLTIKSSTISGKQFVGGIIGDVSNSNDVIGDDGKANEKMVVIDRCGIESTTTIKASDYGGGGLIGSINPNVKLAVTNSYNEGTIDGKGGGLIGYVNAGPYVSIINCYNTGTIKGNDSNPIVAELPGKDFSNAVAIGCKQTQSITHWTEDCTKILKSTSVGNETSVKQNYNANLNNQEFQSTYVLSNLGGDAIEAMMGEKLKGLNFETKYDTEKGTSKLIAKTNATIADGKELTDAFSIPQNVNVDSIYISRSFTQNRWSTIILPFDFIDNYLTSENGNTKEITGAEFYTLTGMKVVDGKWQIQARRIKTLEANKPYLILPKVTGTLTFSGKVALKQTTAGTQTVKDENETGWTFTGVYAAKRWDVDNPPFDESNPKGYQVYGFAGQNQTDKGITAGNFVKVGYNVQIQPLRAYLYYPGLDENPDVADPTPNPNGMPALNKAPRALAKTAAESFELPDNIEVVISEDPIIIESLIIPPAPVVEEDSTDNESGNTGEGNDEDQEGTTAIAKPVTAPVMNKQATWYDLKGRRMGNKPQTQGTYIKNRTPVIVK